MTGPFAAIALALLLGSWLNTVHVLPWVSWHSEAAAFAAVWVLAIGAIGTDLRLRGADAGAVSVPFPAVPLLLFGAIGTLQFAFGRVAFGGDVLVAWFYIGLAIVALAIGYRAAQAGPPPRAALDALVLLAVTLTAGGCLSTSIALAQVFDLASATGWVVPIPEPLRPGANLAQPNQLATLLLMAMASVVALQARQLLGPHAALALLAYLAIGLAMTGSRAGFLGFFTLLGWWFAGARRAFAQVPRAAAVAVAAFYIVAYVGWPRLLTAAGLLANVPGNRLGSMSHRLDLWLQVLDGALVRPWFGWGLQGVTEAHNAVTHRYPGSEALSYSHNVVLDLVVWVGIPAALALVVVALAWAIRRYRPASAAQAWYPLALGIPLVVHSMVEFPYAYAYLLVPAAVGIGYAEGALGVRPALRLGPRAALAALVASAVLLAWSVVEYVDIEDDFRVVRFEQLNLGRTPGDHVVPDVVLLTQLEALLTASRIKLRAGMTPEELGSVRALAMRYPWLATQYRYAVALALNGQPEEAFRQLQVIRAQRGERIYLRVRNQFIELGQTRHPELRGLRLP